MIERKVQALIDKYVPEDMRDSAPAALIQIIMEKMNVANSSGFSFGPPREQTSIDEQLDDIVASLHASYSINDSSAMHAILDNKVAEDARRRLDSGEITDPNNVARLEKMLRTVATIRAAVPGSPEHEEVKNDVAQSVLHVLAAIDEAVASHPYLKDSVGLSLKDWKKHFSKDTAAHAYLTIDEDNRVLASTEYNHFSLSSLDAGLTTYGEKYDGSLLDWSVHVALSNDKKPAYLTAAHENVHVRHFLTVARRLGVDVGVDSKPIVQQLIDAGELQNTVLGALHALGYNMDSSKVVDNGENDKYLRGNATSAVITVASLIRNATGPNVDDMSARGIADILFSKDTNIGIYSIGEVLKEAIGLRDDEFSIGSVYQVSDEISNPAATRKFVEDALGMNPDEFVRQLADSLSEDLGVHIAGIGSNGLSEEEIFGTLGSASGYANTEIAEAIAEGVTLIHLIDSVQNVNLHGEEEKIQRMRDVIDRLFAGEDDEVSGLVRTSDRTIQLLSLYNRLRDAVSDLRWDY